jgi:hypothetical protein
MQRCWDYRLAVATTKKQLEDASQPGILPNGEPGMSTNVNLVFLERMYKFYGYLSPDWPWWSSYCASQIRHFIQTLKLSIRSYLGLWVLHRTFSLQDFLLVL